MDLCVFNFNNLSLANNYFHDHVCVLVLEHKQGRGRQRCVLRKELGTMISSD